MNTLEILTQSKLPFIPLFFNPLPKMMLEEAKALKERFVEHRVDGEQHKGWKNICLHGISPEETEYSTYIEKYNRMEDVPWKWQNIAPRTEEFFRTCFPVSQFLRVRFMLLEPGGKVDKHVDTPGINRLYPINIPLNTPKSCNAWIWVNGMRIRLPYEDCPMIMLDIGYPHAVENNSDEDRYTVIVHYRNSSKVFNWLVQEGYEYMRKYNNDLVRFCV